MPSPVAVFDGHNDVLLEIRERRGDGEWFLKRGRRGDIDLLRCQEGGFVGGMFAVFVPDGRLDFDAITIETQDGWEIPPIDPIDPELAWVEATTMIASLHRLARRSEGRFEVARTSEQLEAAIKAKRVAAVLHLEGAEPLDGPNGFEERLEFLYAAGMRSLGLVWSRPNSFGHGVPFGYPRSPDTGPGLSAAGRKLVRACNELGVLVDLAHLNQRGFRDVARISDAPLVASHAAAHAITPSTRNLTDDQIDAVGASHGIVGINFSVSDIRPDGRHDRDTSLSAIATQAAHVAERIGVEHVGLGSDLDGATMPKPLGDVSGMQRVVEALRAEFSAAETKLVAHGNWLRVLRETWRP